MVVIVYKNFFVEEVLGGYEDVGGLAGQTLYPNWFSFFYWLFKKHCVCCGEPGIVIHHILPRSYGENADDWKNCILVCRKCHEGFHNDGITKASIVKLQKMRAKLLKSYNREGFI